MRRHILLLFFTAGCAAVSAQTPAVPPEYQDIYDSLQTQIAGFDAAVRAKWDGTPTPMVFAPQLEGANSALYTSLGLPGYYESVVLPQLQELQALGARAIKVQVSFPILYQPFYSSNPSQYQTIAGFYQRLAEEIHSRGLQLIVESTAENQFPGANAADFTEYYQTLSWDQYVAARAQNSLATARLMQPEYMSVVTEPDSEAQYTGQTDVATVAGSVQVVQAVLNTLRNAGINGISVGAGTGTWLPNFADFIQGFASTSVQFIDLHVYPLGGNFLLNAIAGADMARAAGKPVAMSGVGDFKIRDSETGVLTLTQVSARDPFSFWAPIDTAFAQALAGYSAYEGVLFVSPFWTHYFSAYLDYGTHGSLPEGPAIIASNAASLTAVLAGRFTSTGLAWLAVSIPHPDTAAPIEPLPPKSNGVYSTSATLNWMPTADNVGVAAYRVFRDGTLVATTSLLSYSDEGLAPGKTYSYTLSAVDASGNVSPLSLPLEVHTSNTAPPSVPVLLTARGTDIKRVDLSWAASSSAIGVAGYEIFRGASAGDLTPYATTISTNFTDAQVSPSLTYYYALLAYDNAGNHSALTPTVAATTPQEPPPSTPGQPAAAPLFNRVSLAWPPSTSAIGVSGYLIFRGTSPATLQQISNTVVPAFVDAHVAPSSSYYYAVTAYDANGLFSAQSAPVAAATPQQPSPTVPGHVLAQSQSFNRITISWTASTSDTGVAGYVIYRGLSPASLSALGVSTGAPYTDSQTAPQTTYFYAVSSYDIYGLASALSPAVSATTLQEAAPTAPPQLSAQATAFNSIALSWQASSGDVAIGGYVVYRGSSPATLAPLATSTATNYTDSLAVPNRTYYYSVAAYDVYGLFSSQAAPVAVTAPQEPPPSAPSQPVAHASAYNQVNLTWGASTGPAELWGYAIYRGTSPSSLSPLGSSTTNAYVDTLAAPSKTYYYAIVAHDIYGLGSAQSAIAAATTPAEPPPSTPSQLVAQSISYNQVSLSWSAASSPVGVGGYAIYRGTAPNNLSVLASAAGTSYLDAQAAPSKTYYYAVAAYDIYGVASSSTGVATAVTPAGPAPTSPQGLTVLALSYNQVALSWSPSSSPLGVAGYAIYRGVTPATLSPIGVSQTTAYTDRSVAASITYYYAIVAYDIYGTLSPVSGPKSATVPRQQ
jgi:fibronectin type 3 domain-containing protein